jgi:mannose-6-phosphate isomerase-like protein (cupin superfamily)
MGEESGNPRQEHPAEENTEENEMKKSLIVLGLGASVIVVASGVGQAQKTSTRHTEKKVIYVAAGSEKYKQIPAEKASMAVLWGDPDKGVHGTFTKFEPGFDAGMHTHTNDVWIVVLKGAYLYKDEAGEKRVGPGDFLRVPGGHKHWSGGDKTEGALFYEEASGKFDSIPAK